MKKLSIEEKAKRYDEAIERAKGLVDFCSDNELKTLEFVFSELKESGNIRIIKAIKYGLDHVFTNNTTVFEVTKEQCLAWLEKQGEHANFCNKIQIGDKVTRNKDGVLVNLSQLNRVAKPAEKQGEQKPVDKTKPKFKVGDFIINDYCMGKVIELINDAYLLDTGQGIPFSCEHNAHLWTIQDAKDGDVLFTSSTASHETFIFKSIDEKGNVKCYFAYDSEDSFREGKYHFIGRATNCKPATKEQCDLLFQKMYEAGYEWDAEKKELKKILQEYPLTPDECIKPAWSEEDCNRISSIKYLLHELDNYNFDNWLDSLKDRVQPKQKWSKEDKERYISCLQRLSTGNPEQPETINSKWFKEHVCPQNTWKPSDAQMASITCAVRKMKESACYDSELVSLLNDLKKLREE